MTTTAYNLAVYDISMGLGRARLVETVWRGDDYDRGEDQFHEECERIARMIRSSHLEPKSTLIILRQADGTEEERCIV